MNEDMFYKLYVLAEIKYKKENNKIPDENLFPDNWHLNSDYKTKIKIIGEALNKKCLIKDTITYMDIQDGVKLKNSI